MAVSIPVNLGPVFSRWETPGGRINISGMAGELLANSSSDVLLGATGALNQISITPTGANNVIGLTNGISLGSLQSITPPTGGMLIPNQVSIGTGTLDSNTFFQVTLDGANGSWPFTIRTDGNKTGTSGGSFNNMCTYLDATTFNPTGNVFNASSFQSDCTFSLGAGVTATEAIAFHSQPFLNGNLGTIGNFYGIRSEALSGTAGTVTNAYGGYFSSPGYGTNYTALATDDLCIGVAPSGIPVHGTIRSAPVVSSSAFNYTTTVDQVPVQNTLGYDALYSGTIAPTLVVDAAFLLGVGSTSAAASAAEQAITPTLTAPAAVNYLIPFSVYVPNNYWIVIVAGSDGAGNSGIATGIVTPV